MGVLDIHVVSTGGPVRDENQDAALAWQNGAGELFLILSDGMGGHQSGREAAEIVVRVCAESIRQCDGQPRSEVLTSAILKAHNQVRTESRGESGSQMGATVVLGSVNTEVSPPVLNLAHVGDSRAYLCRGNSIYRLTSDHSLVRQMVRDGYLTEEQAFRHPDSNILQRAIGQSAPLEPEIHEPLPLDFGDVLIFCSDGLHGVVPDRDILLTTRHSDSSEGICRQLLAAALDAGSEDNISIICARLREKGGKPRQTRPG